MKVIRPYAERICDFCKCDCEKYSSDRIKRSIDYTTNQIGRFISEHTSISPGPVPLITGILIGLTIGIPIGWLF